MHKPASRQDAGLLGPVSVFWGVLLLALSPVMRGGNRYVALVPLEFLALLVLLALWTRWLTTQQTVNTSTTTRAAVILLVLSPAVMALVQLVPVPSGLWAQLPGHSIYPSTLADIGAPAVASRALSVSPDATKAALLAGIPIVAGFLLGYLASLTQLKIMMRVVVVVAFAEVLLGLLQVSGGEFSQFYVGVLTFGQPIGSFANRNHYANYLAMALAAYIWLTYEAGRPGNTSPRAIDSRALMGIRIAGGLVLVVGILMSRSRGGALFGLSMALAAMGAVSLRLRGWAIGWRVAVPIALLVILGAIALIGFESVSSRISMDQLSSSAGFRSALASTSLDGAMAFWPWGSGWGTYEFAYPRFQPISIAGYANHAHQDYIEMLFEGGIFFVLFAAAFAWLAVVRLVTLVRSALQRPLGSDAMASALCGLGLLGLLLHSLVEFNMRIPANAILGALLAGAYLRPLGNKGAAASRDRPALPHLARH